MSQICPNTPVTRRRRRTRPICKVLASEFGFKNCRSFFACFSLFAPPLLYIRSGRRVCHIRKCSNACNPSILMTGHIFYPIFFLFSLLDWMVIHIFADTATGFVGGHQQKGRGGVWDESEASFYEQFAWKTTFFFLPALSPNCYWALLRVHVAAMFRGISYKILNECNQNFCVH